MSGKESVFLNRAVICVLMASVAVLADAGSLSAAASGPGPIESPPRELFHFSDVTTEAGLNGLAAFRLSIADVNGDHYPDIFAHIVQNDSTGDVLNKQFLYLNVQGDVPGDPYSRKFIDYTAQSGIRANRQGTPDGRHSDSGIFADVDNDGDLDLFTMVYVHTNYGLDLGRNDLLLNDGNGHFTLAPNSPFHTEEIYNTAGAVFLDYDNDGNVDLFIGNWYRPSGVLTTDQLYRGHGDGSFTNVTSAAGIDAATSCIYGVAAADWNGDGFMDLFVPPYSHTVSGSTPILWQNNGDGTFSQVQVTSHYDEYRGYGSGKASFGSMPWDYDNDGDVDFFEILVHGSGDAGSGVHSTVVTNQNDVFSWDFHQVSGRGNEDPNLGHHGDHYASWFDMENDGFPDFVLTESGYGNNRIYVFKQASDHTFSPITPATGLDSINAANLPPHNVMPLDYDLDGDEDLLVGFASTDPVQLWRNEIGTGNNWLTVTLRGAGGAGKSNRSAIGARVQVAAGGRTYTREVYAGNGHHGPQVPLSRSFGLGSASVVDSLRVDWPNANHTTTVLDNVAVNQFLEIEEPADSDVCEIDLVNDTHSCTGMSAITFVEEPSSGEVVLKVNLDPAESGFARAIFEVEYGATPSGWTVNVGDSATNNGGGGDAATQSHDAEMQVYDTTMKMFGSAGTPTYPLGEVSGLVQSGIRLTLDVSNEQLRWHNYSGEAETLVSPYLYALAGQPDSEGPVNYDIYAAFNRTIAAPWRNGSGVTRVRIRLFSDSTVCEVDLLNDTHTCAGISALDFVQPPNGGEVVLSANLDPSVSGFTKAIFDIAYGSSPSDWTVNIGDSATNNGAGGDAATQSNDAEVHIHGTTMKVFGKDATPVYPLAEIPGIADLGTLLTLAVSNELLHWDNRDGDFDVLISPYLYALDGQPDSEGPINYDIFAAFNRVIGTQWRYGAGVSYVTVILEAEP